MVNVRIACDYHIFYPCQIAQVGERLCISLAECFFIYKSAVDRIGSGVIGGAFHVEHKVIVENFQLFIIGHGRVGEGHYLLYRLFRFHKHDVYFFYAVLIREVHLIGLHRAVKIPCVAVLEIE